MTYRIHDGTGSIQGKVYISQDNDSVKSMYSFNWLFKYSQNGYCSIIGNLSSLNSTLSINIHHIQPIHNYNEIINHFLNVILCYSYYKNHEKIVCFLLQLLE